MHMYAYVLKLPLWVQRLSVEQWEQNRLLRSD